ncbi:MAG: outer membrane protein [Allosphingosinicella sp.]
MKAMFFVTVGLLSLATPATAQNFSGFRAEGRLGYDWASINAEYQDPGVRLEYENDEDGFTFGGEIGYDFQVGHGVTLGVYAGADFSDADFCRQVNLVDQACLEVKRDLYLGGRIGAQVGPSTQLFAKAGYTNGQAEIEYNDVDNVVDDLVDSDSRDGWHFGAGVEQNFGPNVYGKLEFLYTIYSDLDFANPDYTVTVDGNRARVMGGVGVRF